MPKRIFILSVFLLLSITSIFGQDYLAEKRNDIKEALRNLYDTTYKISLLETVIQLNPYRTPEIDTLTHFDTIANLSLVITGKEKIKIVYFFDKIDNNCDSVIVQFYCNECVDNHMKILLKNKFRNWKKLGADSFLSRTACVESYLKRVSKVGIPKMIIKRTPQQEVFATMYLSVQWMEEEKWKELLNKIN